MDHCSHLYMHEVHSHVVATDTAHLTLWIQNVGSPLGWARGDASSILELSDGVITYRNGSHPGGSMFP